ncbi:MAG: hypothetical protein K6C34_02835, partial [Alphaproteobacteria bacterium]|nr:hypothetical protein [Alphaproteobacteria bacterium]
MLKKLLLAVVSTFVLSLYGDISVNATADVKPREMTRGLGAPNFVPIPAEKLSKGTVRGSILVVGGHPDDHRWQNFWPRLAEQYDLTFIYKQDEFDTKAVNFRPCEGMKILTQWNDELEADVAVSQDGHVRVWNLDFNRTDFSGIITKLVKPGEFNLIINDHSVFKFFAGETERRLATFAPLLTVGGCCVFGPMGSQCGSPFDLEQYINADAVNSWRTSYLGHYFAWNIGGTESEKNSFTEIIRSSRAGFAEFAALFTEQI